MSGIVRVDAACRATGSARNAEPPLATLPEVASNPITQSMLKDANAETQTGN
jgi:hypothetical protein